MAACLFLFSFENNKANSEKAQGNEKSSNLEEVKIGTQTWSTKNLNVSTFRNGDTIPEAKTNEEWKKAGEEGKPAWCYYNNDPENGKKYGKLYNWYAVNDPRGLAPKGWHVPTDAEWTILTDYLRRKKVAGTKMKSTGGWDEWDGKTGNGTNTSGFTGSPGGFRSNYGVFSNVCRFSAWWSSSEATTDGAWARALDYKHGKVSRDSYYKSCGFFVRVLRD